MSTTPAKSAKRVSKKTEEAAVPVVTVVEVKDTKAKAKTTKKTETKVEAPVAVAVTAPVVTAPVVTATTTTTATTVAVSEEVKLEQEVKDAVANLVKLRESLTEAIKHTQKLQKKAAKLQKVADKRRKRKTDPNAISIFQIPQSLSTELCTFMDRPAGSKESRSNVTKYVTKYIKDQSLKADKHNINPDAKLKALLKVPETVTLSYFNLQTYLNSHYIKPTPA
jgi:chromatin remodeling complex protein RSC6